MASFLDDPYKMQYLGQVGLGLMQAAQPAPYGVNRMSYVTQAVNTANQNMRMSQLFDMKMKDREEEKAEKAAQKTAMSSLIEGQDPSTGITWDTGRAGLMDNDRMSLMAQANPEMFSQLIMKQAFAGQADPEIIKDAEGYNRYSTGDQKGERAFPGVQKPPAQGGQSMYKVKDEDSPTGWSYADRQGNPSIKGAAPPSGGQEITVGPDGSVRVGPMTGAQAGKLTQDSINREDKSTENIGEIEASLDDLARVDYSTGIPGYAIDELGGLLAQLPLVGNDLAKKLGTEEVANVRSSLQGLVARMVSTYTGEESGRITKEELAISQAASKAKDPKADMTQIVGALNSIREIEMRVVARERMKQANIPDLTSSVGRQKYVDSLRKQHPDETDEALVDRLVEAMRTYKIFNNYKKYDPR